MITSTTLYNFTIEQIQNIFNIQITSSLNHTINVVKRLTKSKIHSLMLIIY
jgi:hypothetical protein